MKNLFQPVSGDLPEEVVESLLSGQEFRVERIVSQGHRSPPDFWYDQAEHEWVVLLTGAGVIEFEDQSSVVEMKPGDALLIPAHRRHRVLETSVTEQSIWLAIFFRDDKMTDSDD
ncbi:Cupin domain protein [Thalassoglobus neptunius]|uniref:Cupin domain protein n=1 Tax=Thalassoglobus neptunius TaxID=1938619 RepID=A0A5C5VR66_9PLAN|nr:cupin domain-containing protein [Thalassoglobus neptunius]TWT40179.1 Cupin domain protein [Thalassoglobus neptunius]